MLNAIKTILADKMYYCNDVAIKLLDAEEDKIKNKILSNRILTSRQAKILKLIAMEMTNDEIAQKLFVSNPPLIPTGKTCSLNFA